MSSTDSRSRDDKDFSGELSLLDLLLILLKRKWLVVMVFAAVMLAAVGYLVTAKPVYLSRAVIAVGYLPDLSDITQIKPRWIEDPQLLVKRIVEEYRLNDHEEKSDILPAMHSVVLDKNSGEGIVVFSAKGGSAEEARDFLNSLVLGILTKHKELYDEAYAELELLAESKRTALNNIDKEANDLLKFIDRLSKDSSGQAPFYMRLSLLLEQKLNFSNQHDDLRTKLNLKYNPTEILRQPTLPSDQYEPEVILIILSAFVVAVFLSVFLVFMVEYFQYARNYVRRNSG